MENRSRIEVRDLDLSYGDRVIQRDLNFAVEPGDIFVIMGPSGSGKSTLLRGMIGLVPPARGDVYYDDASFWTAGESGQQRILRRVGVLYQEGALWSSMTLAENVALPVEQFTDLPPATIREIASLKLALVGLAGFEEFYPSEISGGMRKRAGLARAMALDPDILFFDEPSSGLDPISSRRLDDLILELRDSLGATVVMVTHEHLRHRHELGVSRRRVADHHRRGPSDDTPARVSRREGAALSHARRHGDGLGPWGARRIRPSSARSSSGPCCSRLRASSC